MLTLTLRAAGDGRFLARIVEQSGNVFVLDFGDQRVIDDATQRIHRGFTVFRGGQLVKAAPRSADLLVLLADFYAGEGMLVSLEEPLWPNRAQTLEDMLAERTEEDVAELTAESLSGLMGELGDLDEETQDLPTDVWGRDEAERVKALIGEARDRAVRTTWSPPTSLGAELDRDGPLDLGESLEDAPTVEVERQTPDGPPTLVEDEDDATEVAVHPRFGAPGAGFGKDVDDTSGQDE